MKIMLTFFSVIAGLIIGISVLSIRADIPVDDLVEKYGGPTSHFAKIDGMNVHFRDEGTGPVLVLVHGSNASLHTWDGWTEQMKDQFRIIRMDLSGHGLTGPDPRSRYTVSDYVNMVDALVQHLGVEIFSIGGNSLGGAVAWNYTVRHPDNVEKLILVDAAGYPWEEPLPLILRLAGMPVIGQVMSVVTPRFGIRDSIQQVYGNPSRVTDALVTRYHQLLLREGNRDATYLRFRQGFSIENVDLIQSISVPTLIQWGARDTWILPKYAERFHQDIAGSVLHIYPDLGHVPMEEDPLKTAQDTRAFLNRAAP
jgi:pimeloyl-ACP methyl ester carboxylesterase